MCSGHSDLDRPLAARVAPAIGSATSGAAAPPQCPVARRIHLLATGHKRPHGRAERGHGSTHGHTRGRCPRSPSSRSPERARPCSATPLTMQMSGAGWTLLARLLAPTATTSVGTPSHTFRRRQFVSDAVRSRADQRSPAVSRLQRRRSWSRYLRLGPSKLMTGASRRATEGRWAHMTATASRGPDECRSAPHHRRLETNLR
jgi:hypothetical protein